MGQRWGKLAVLPILWCAAFAPGASASTAYVSEAGELVFAASPGEKNYVTVSDPGVTIEVGDTAGITPGAGCEAMDPTRVRCPGFNPGSTIGRTLIDLGDGDDFYHEQSELFKDDVNAGPGNDEVYGSRETDTIRGQDGDDILWGGGAADKIDGGAGNDSIKGGNDDDTIFGGAGADILDGDGDGLHDGNDTISAEDGEIDRVACGGGSDSVTADEADTVHETCDVVKRVDVIDPPPPTPGAVTAKVARSSSLAKFLSSGFAFQASADRKVAFAAVLYVPASAARKLGLGTKDTRIAQGSGAFGPGSASGKLTKRFKTSRLRALLRKGGSAIPVVFQALAQDENGETFEVVKKSKLRR